MPKPVLDAFDEAFDAADVSEEYRPVLRHVFAHVYYCQTRMPDRYGDGVPLSHGLLKQACREAEGVDVPTRTEDIWESVEGELLAVSDYIYREEGVGRSREFRLVEDLMRRLDGALENGYEYKTRYNLIDGKRLRSGFQTALTYDGEHSWEQRSTFIYKTLKRLRGQRDVVNKAAAENHLDRLEAEKQAAQERYDRLQAELDQLKGQILEEGKSLSESEQKRLSDARETVCKAGREKERAESRWRQDARIWADIIAQGLEEAEDQPEGICEYETAYEVQPGSGRLTCICGLQNASEEMKAAAAKGTVHYRNVDIKSSQTEAIIQEMEMAVSMGADLNLSAIKGYIEAGGKDALADEHGIYRDRWKRPEHSVKFGAGFNHDTYAAALGAAKGKVLSGIKDDDDDPDFSQLYQFENESGEAAWHRAVYKELPTMAAVARDWADDDEIVYDDPEEVYSILQDAYGEMAEELDAWRDWLVDEYWTEAGQHGSQFGYFVSNPCSLPFSIHDTRLADSNGEDEEISRYNQKAGFATSRLQGSESAFMHALALIQDDFEYEFLRNEHDGAVVLGEIPEEAVQMARLISGFHRAELEEKPFEGHNSNNTETNDTETCDTTTSKDPSAQNQLEKPSKSPTSPNGGKSGAGSANGTTGPGGAKSERTPSGSAQVSPEQSATTSGTTCEGTDPSDSSTGRSRKETSKTSSGATTGATSPEEKAVQARLERKRRVREGEVPTGMQQALEEGFSKAEWKWAQRNAAASAA
ncbi:hypothetical protein [Salinibacter grassmerensis]|uniref:hypothetical protein n=1 Tax=Salinibacter grassmerensis TaxID=3040353 RepID=UPI0021E8D2B4|nr:hypothetical protein [Salinibacter grassmerensis]